jgi:high affinity Mn2+ porin
MYNGAWDYAADTRGYTWGWVHELHLRDWSFRYASALEPKIANGLRFDRRIFQDRGDVFEAEHRHALAGHTGAVRALSYLAHTNSGSYGAALQLAAATNTTPDIDKVLHHGTGKYGFGLNAEQELTHGIGVFSRLGWNDGKTEDFAFTAIDRIATGGVSLPGRLWRRPNDTFASEFTANGLSAVHALYLARGGVDFIIGDGKLNYAPEAIWESYYMTRVPADLFGARLYVTVDAQRIVNPGYNQDRGPLWAWSLRLHMEAGGTR